MSEQKQRWVFKEELEDSLDELLEKEGNGTSKLKGSGKKVFVKSIEKDRTSSHVRVLIQ